MKKSVIVILTCMMGLQALSEIKHCIVIHEAQGQTAFNLEQKPVVSFTETDVKMVCGDTEVLYPLTNGLKLTIEDTDIETSVMDVTDTPFTITSSDITVRGCKSLSLYTLDGKVLVAGKADLDGMATISISKFTRGTYIIKTDNKAFKIIKK